MNGGFHVTLATRTSGIYSISPRSNLGSCEELVMSKNLDEEFNTLVHFPFPNRAPNVVLVSFEVGKHVVSLLDCEHPI